MKSLLTLLQITDSTFPVGTFSFSNGLETAAHLGLVHDAPTLEAYTDAVSRQAAFTDGVAALHALKAAQADDYDSVAEADRRLIACKFNDEARLMLTRMGRKLGELAVKLWPDAPMPQRWLDDVKADILPGTYPVAQALAAAQGDIDAGQLFASHQYGVINMVLSAALRCVRVSHYDTQIILHRLLSGVPDLYARAAKLPLDGMHAFAPEADVFASLHEKGSQRLFMN